MRIKDFGNRGNMQKLCRIVNAIQIAKRENAEIVIIDPIRYTSEKVVITQIDS